MTPSPYQRAIYSLFRNTSVNINISAVAGSGKTTTLLTLLRYVPEGESCLFLAFNNSIVDELRKRTGYDTALPSYRKTREIMTIHSCGWRSLLIRYGGRVKMNPNKGIAKTEAILQELKTEGRILSRDSHEARRQRGYYYWVVPKMLDLIRCNLVDGEDKGAVRALGMHYNIALGDDDLEVVSRAYGAMARDKSQFDFMDMIWVPVVDPSVRVKKWQYVFCDESQDFSLAQHAFIKACIARGGRLITVGDENQAIYGFAGADADSYRKLAGVNGRSVKMPLSYCYRCGEEIVREAAELVPAIRPWSGAGRGKVREGSLTEVRRGDWIVCRNVRPLVAAYLWLMKNRIKAKIRGKEIGEGLLRLINKSHAHTLSELFDAVGRMRVELAETLRAKGVRNPSGDPRAELLWQQSEVLRCLGEEVKSLAELKKMLREIFDDNVRGVVLSTIHKAKGLENDRVFFLCPELIPSRWAVQDWEYVQERNLFYVALTRAREELVYVRGDTFLSDIRSKVTLGR